MEQNQEGCKAMHDHQLVRTRSHLERQKTRADPGRGQYAKGRQLSKSSATGKPRAWWTGSSQGTAEHSRELGMLSGLGPKCLTLFSGSPGSAASSLETNLSILLSEGCLLWPMLCNKCACWRASKSEKERLSDKFPIKTQIHIFTQSQYETTGFRLKKG